MISRDEAIQKLKVYWEVSEFTFLARFDVPISQQEIDEPNAFGFFKEIYWNKKRAPYTLRYVTANYSIFDFLLHLTLKPQPYRLIL